MIIDLSEWQEPELINYEEMARELEGAIVRVQYGGAYEDQAFHRHLGELQARGIPCAVYAWVKGKTPEAMAEEAKTFYERAKPYQPVYWWLDIEEFSMEDMRGGCEVYRQTLKSCGAKKVGAYIANHLFADLAIDVERFDAIWLPSYGENTGELEGVVPSATTNYQLHQYTSNARISGYEGPVDANQLHDISFYHLFPENKNNEVFLNSQNEQVEARGIWKSYRLFLDVYLSEEPKIYAKKIALLPTGSVIIFSDILINEGFLWGVQQREDGTTGYLPMGEMNNYGEFI